MLWPLIVSFKLPNSSYLITSGCYHYQVMIDQQLGDRGRRDCHIAESPPMLFTIVMDSLCKLFAKAEQSGILEPFSNRHSIPQRISIYADDVILFLKARRLEVAATKLLLDIFGCSSGLRCNLGKSSLSSIFCEKDQVEAFGGILNCKVVEMSFNYLGLPLSLMKLRKEDFQCLIDKLRNRLGPWRIGFLQQSGRLILVQAVLSAVPIFHLMSLDRSCAGSP